MAPARRLALILMTLMVVQASLGLLLPDQYKDADWIRATWYGNDWIVAVLDLSLMVPGLTVSGVLLWTRRPWGYVTAAIASIQGALYLLVLSVNSGIAIRRGLAAAPGELPIWLPLLVLTAFAAIVLLRCASGHLPALALRRRL